MLDEGEDIHTLQTWDTGTRGVWLDPMRARDLETGAQNILSLLRQQASTGSVGARRAGYPSRGLAEGPVGAGLCRGPAGNERREGLVNPFATRRQPSLSSPTVYRQETDRSEEGLQHHHVHCQPCGGLGST